MNWVSWPHVATSYVWKQLSGLAQLHCIRVSYRKAAAHIDNENRESGEESSRDTMEWHSEAGEEEEGGADSIRF